MSRLHTTITACGGLHHRVFGTGGLHRGLRPTTDGTVAPQGTIGIGGQQTTITVGIGPQKDPRPPRRRVGAHISDGTVTRQGTIGIGGLQTTVMAGIMIGLHDRCGTGGREDLGPPHQKVGVHISGGLGPRLDHSFIERETQDLLQRPHLDQHLETAPILIKLAL